MPAHNITRRRVIEGAAVCTALIATPAIARPLFMRGGGPPTPPVSGSEVTTFVLTESTGTAGALGYKRIGLPIKAGDVPATSRLRIERGGVPVPAQFDARNTWRWFPDNPSFVGTLRFAACNLRDTPFSAGESRTYSVIRETGSYDNSTHALSLTDALSGTDFRVELTSFTGEVTGSFPDHLTSLNAAATRPTRITKIESGPICDTWEIWDYVRDESNSPHAHLRVRWHFTVQKDAGGSIVAYEVCCVFSLSKWATAGKEKLFYVATLKNGATVIETYGGHIDYATHVRNTTVTHIQRSEWATVRLTDDNEHASRHWIGAARPTLTYKPNKHYWISTGMIPPFDQTITFALNPTAPSEISGPYEGCQDTDLYQPCTNQGHRAAIDAGGGYPGEEMLTKFDVIAFCTPTPLNVRVARVNWHVGLHVPYHQRSEHMRTRPGDGGVSDEAFTIPALIVQDAREAATPTSYYDFQPDGMPAPVHGYIADVSPYNDGWVAPPGSSGTAPVAYRVGDRIQWLPSDTTTHFNDYCWFGYLYEAERHILNALVDVGINSITQRNQGARLGTLLWIQNGVTVFPGTPTTKWTAICYRAITASERAYGRGFKAISGLTLLPDDDVQANYAARVFEHNVLHLAAHRQYIPSSNVGTWHLLPPNGGSGFMHALDLFDFYTVMSRTGHHSMRPMCEWMAKMPIRWANADEVGRSGNYHMYDRPRPDLNWNSSTNDYFTEVFSGYSSELTGSPSTSITNSIVKAADRTGPAVEVGTEVLCTNIKDGFVAGAIVPAELAVGTIYYACNPINNANYTFRLSTTADGLNPIDFASDYSGEIGLAFRYSHATTQSPNTYHQVTETSSQTQWRAGLILAYLDGHPDATLAQIAKFDAWINHFGFNYVFNCMYKLDENY